MAPQTCWVVCDDGKVGTEHQCVGLAEALGHHPHIKRLQGRGIWRYLPPTLWFRPLSGVICDQLFLPPWPDLIIAAGRLSVAPTAYIRRLTAGRTRVIQLQNPCINPRFFDAVIAPHHDRLQGSNIFRTQGALHRITTERLRSEGQRFTAVFAHLPRPLIGVLIGGDNGCYKMSPETTRRMTERLRQVARQQGGTLVVVVSRRTSDDVRTILRQKLKDSGAYVWTGEGDNPYYGILALADYLILTSDSVSMASEACFTGKPVYTYFLPGGSRKFNAFHAYFQQKGYTRPFEDHLETWAYPPLDEFQDVIRWLKSRL